jgi:hypothetical protein
MLYGLTWYGGNRHKVLFERHTGSLFLISVIAFAIGIYIEAIYPVSLMVSLILCVFFLCFIPIALSKTLRIASCIILICFVFAGMVRLGIVTENRSEIISNKTKILKPDTNTSRDIRNLSFLNSGDGRLPDEEMNIYEGLVAEASPNTKIIKLISPKDSRGLRVILRTQDNLTINDRVKVFGYMKELNLTFKNPSMTSWILRHGESFLPNGSKIQGQNTPE